MADYQSANNNYAKPCIRHCKKKELNTAQKTQFYKFVVQRITGLSERTISFLCGLVY